MIIHDTNKDFLDVKKYPTITEQMENFSVEPRNGSVVWHTADAHMTLIIMSTYLEEVYRFNVHVLADVMDHWFLRDSLFDLEETLNFYVMRHDLTEEAALDIALIYRMCQKADMEPDWDQLAQKIAFSQRVLEEKYRNCMDFIYMMA